MDVKKKNFFDNFRLKSKFANLKKKKAFGKQGKPLSHRRSISVPDLRFAQVEAVSTESALVSDASDAVSVVFSTGLSDTDSVGSSAVTDVLPSTDKPSPSLSENRLRVPTEHPAKALNRVSAPVESISLYEEIDNMMKSSSDRKMNLAGEALYAQPDKGAKRKVPIFTFDPIPAPRSGYTNIQASSPRPQRVERENLSRERLPEATQSEGAIAGTIASALARANSLREQTNPYKEQKTKPTEQGKPSSLKGTPPATRVQAPKDRMSLAIDYLGVPTESAEGTSLDSPCGSPTEEPGKVLWMTALEGLDQDMLPLMTELYMEDSLPDGAQPEDAIEEMEVSFFVQYIVIHEHLEEPIYPMSCLA